MLAFFGGAGSTAATAIAAAQQRYQQAIDAAAGEGVDDAWDKLIGSGSAVSRDQVQEFFYRNIAHCVSNPCTEEQVEKLHRAFKKISGLKGEATPNKKQKQPAQKRKAAPARLQAAPAPAQEQ